MDDLLAFDRAHIWHPYASVANPPPVRLVKEAHGVNLTLHDGSTLVDAVSSWWCVAHGHSHPHIVEAMRRQSERLSHVMFGGLTHEPAIALAERLVQFTPPGLDRVFFADSGSISVEVAAKMAVQYQHARGLPRKGKLVALLGGYHGDTCCAMALSDPDGMHTLFRSIMPQHYFADPLDFDTLARVVEEHGDEIAGVICEPYFQAANAMRFYSPDYLRQMRALCDERGLLLIFDEIAAGFHRTGPLWAHARAGVSPDILCVGKALTGGHVTLAATIASARVAETISSGSPGAFMHGPTYMANPRPARPARSCTVPRTWRTRSRARRASPHSISSRSPTTPQPSRASRASCGKVSRRAGRCRTWRTCACRAPWGSWR